MTLYLKFPISIAPLLIAAAASMTFLRKQIGAAFSALSWHLRRRPDVEGV